MKLLVDELPKEPNDCLFYSEGIGCKLNALDNMYIKEGYNDGYYGDGSLNSVELIFGHELDSKCDLDKCPYFKKYNAGIDFLKIITKDEK